MNALLLVFGFNLNACKFQCGFEQSDWDFTCSGIDGDVKRAVRPDFVIAFALSFKFPTVLVEEFFEVSWFHFGPNLV